MRESRRDLVHVVCNQDGRWCFRMDCEVRKPGDEVLPAAEVESGGRLVEQQQ